MNKYILLKEKNITSKRTYTLLYKEMSTHWEYYSTGISKLLGWGESGYKHPINDRQLPKNYQRTKLMEWYE